MITVSLKTFLKRFIYVFVWVFRYVLRLDVSLPKSILSFHYLFICIYVCVHAYDIACPSKSEDNLGESVLSFHYLSFRDRTQVIRLEGKSPCFILRQRLSCFCCLLAQELPLGFLSSEGGCWGITAVWLFMLTLGSIWGYLEPWVLFLASSHLTPSLRIKM